MVDFAKLRAERAGKIKLEESRWDCPPPGEHDAVCIDVLSFKAERYNRDGDIFETQVLYIVWLVYPKDQYGRPMFDSKGEPFKVDKQFNPTMASGNKYGVRGILESWAGRELTIQETNSFDMVSVIGKPCKLSIETKQAKSSGTIYPNVLTAEPCENKTEFWVKAETYKPRDYSQDLKARKRGGSQTQGESAWEPEPGTLTSKDDTIPF